jgi:hypothetical protein
MLELRLWSQKMEKIGRVLQTPVHSNVCQQVLYEIICG